MASSSSSSFFAPRDPRSPPASSSRAPSPYLIFPNRSTRLSHSPTIENRPISSRASDQNSRRDHAQNSTANPQDATYHDEPNSYPGEEQGFTDHSTRGIPGEAIIPGHIPRERTDEGWKVGRTFWFAKKRGVEYPRSM